MTQITKGDTDTLAPPVNWILFVLVLDQVFIKIPKKNGRDVMFYV